MLLSAFVLVGSVGSHAQPYQNARLLFPAPHLPYDSDAAGAAVVGGRVWDPPAQLVRRTRSVRNPRPAADPVKDEEQPDTISHQKDGPVAYANQIMQIAATDLPLPSIQGTPSPQDAFIFFHFRKTGGTNLRIAVAHEAQRLNLSMLVPCKETQKGNVMAGVTKVDFRDKPVVGTSVGTDRKAYLPRFQSKTSYHKKSCLTYTFNHSGLVAHQKRHLVSIYAGHFRWENVRYLKHVQRSTATSHEAGAAVPAPKFSCIMLVRDPTKRFMSCYRERLQKQVGGRRVTELSESELRNVIYNKTSIDGGCANEIPRWTAPYDTFDKFPNNGLLPRSALETAKSRMSQCVLLNYIEDCVKSQAMAKHWFPWIRHSLCRRYGKKEPHRGDMTAAFKGRKNQSKNVQGEQHSALLRSENQATRLIIVAANAQEQELYDFAMMRIDMQWKEYTSIHPEESLYIEEKLRSKTLNGTIA